MLAVTIRRLLVAGGVVAVASLLLVPAASADHGGPNHNGEMMELSKSEDLEDGETVTVTVSNFLPGNTVTVLTCYNFPVAGPGDCDFSNMGQFTAMVGDDGTATVEYPVNMVPGRCDASTSCFVIASDGIGPASNSAAQAFTFAATAMAEPEPTEAPAPTTTAAPPTTTAAPPPTTAAPPPTTAAPAPEPTEAAAAPADAADDGGSAATWLVPVIIVAAVLALGALWLARRKTAST